MGKIDLDIEETGVKLTFPNSSTTSTIPSSISITKEVSWLTKSSRDARYVLLLRGAYVLSYSYYGYGWPQTTYLDTDDKYHVYEAGTTTSASSNVEAYRTITMFRLFIINKDMHITWYSHPGYTGGTMTFLRL